MKIAIVGSGISGLVCAHLLHRQHDICIYESSPRIGGHTHTVTVDNGGKSMPVDTGFIVFNDWTYPNFIQLLEQLGVASQPSEMSFSVRCEHSGFEYSGTTLNTLFAQRTNLLRPSFYCMIREIMRFNREAPELLVTNDASITLGQYLDAGGYSQDFRHRYIIPMGAAIWSAPASTMVDFPALMFIRFFKNHGMLSVNDRPQWRTISGGSSTYVRALTAPIMDRIQTGNPVISICRLPSGVELTTADGTRDLVDEVILACHSDQALKLLADPTPEEREILGAIPYQLNEAILHTDTSLMPKRKLAWASWNYHLPKNPLGRVAVTYNMNILQALPTDTQYMVTLNHDEPIHPDTIIQRITYHHPVFSPETPSAQHRHCEISNTRHTHYCGAYWRYGFHEDGVMSALRVCADGFDAWLHPDFVWTDAHSGMVNTERPAATPEILAI